MREDTPLIGRWIVRGFQSYWRVARGFHLLVEACIFDETGRVLLLGEPGEGWDLPRGRARRDEAAETALLRVLRETAGIEVNASPELSFISPEGQNKQIAIYFVRDWRYVSGLAPRTTQLFRPGSLPASVNEQAAERIRRCVGSSTNAQV